jgi:hypothetical protein
MRWSTVKSVISITVNQDMGKGQGPAFDTGQDSMIVVSTIETKISFLHHRARVEVYDPLRIRIVQKTYNFLTGTPS